jgi:hypothetical protein
VNWGIVLMQNPRFLFHNSCLSRHQNVGRNRGIKIANRLFENISQFKYLDSSKSKFDLGGNE